ncbi:hypothetical protein [Nocardia seriolae]|uniref:Class I SAM-dependent methyltransferase n=1 Tax=Nocardia seriolae TaxID=37332 RepID=A0ABC9Z4P0_9NOCA|nr:hypothetical protein [Nocardia seriolae]BEK98052.1 hypothetical protein NSER024013_59580 [Nocardia seriolae]GAM50610.1 hypothetical protein NS07_v2contig00162-0013 [Nocardia seriolae]GAP32557.1 hypothetical protein NSK11_contig00165-0005 [Nocardia seriolae]
MTDLVLTPQRRTELSALLADEPRLHAEYPRVAEYLDTASRLPGTGDERADATFDLRLVHYLTGGASENPYWDIVEPAVSETARRRVVNGKRVTGSARLAFAQTILQSTYAYAIPSPETAAWIADVCDGGPVTEIGAGRGYWAAQLTRAGLTVHAYDSEPPDITENPAFPATPGQRPLWHPVSADPTAARKAGRHDHTLLLCWPPGWGNSMASTALTAYTRAGGTHLLYIGEPPGGKTADTPFFEALDHHWHLTSEDPRYVSWWNLNDRAQLWTRRR